MSSGLRDLVGDRERRLERRVPLAMPAPDREAQPERVARVTLGLARAGPPREVDRAREHLGRLRPVVEEHQDLPVAREHARQLGRRRLLGDERDRVLVRLERRHRFAVVPERAPEPLLRDPLADRVSPASATIAARRCATARRLSLASQAACATRSRSSALSIPALASASSTAGHSSRARSPCRCASANA